MKIKDQVTDLRTNTSTGQWLDIQKAAMTGDGSSKSPLYTGAIGEYNSVILKSAFDVTTGVTNAGALASNVRRAVFLGAQAAVVGYGMKHAGGKYLWNEELIDSSVAVRAANDNLVNSGDLLAA